jgi:glutathione synthase
MLESSDAFKCPSVAYQLAGTKKVQQDLERPGVVESFVPDASDAAEIREHFAGRCSLLHSSYVPCHVVLQIF